MPLNKKIRAACIQTDCLPMNLEVNFKRARELFIQARDEGAEIAILPELSDRGYDLPNLSKASLSNREMPAFLADIASELKIAVGGGYLELMEEQRFDSFAVFGPGGEKIANYRKRKLFSLTGEIEIFSPGWSSSVFYWKGFRFGISICFELRFPGLSWDYRMDGCDILLYPSAFASLRYRHWETLLEARAIETQCYIMAANRCGKDGTSEFCGRSRVLDPWGNLIFSAEADVEGVVTADIDKEKIEEIRKHIPVC